MIRIPLAVAAVCASMDDCSDNVRNFCPIGCPAAFVNALQRFDGARRSG
jgi:hypothetical protein